MITAEYHLVPFLIEAFIEMAKQSQGEGCRSGCRGDRRVGTDCSVRALPRH
jgi:hypothetical protein